MLFKRLALVFTVLLLLALLWRCSQSAWFQGWWNGPTRGSAPRVEFDNGTLRPYESASQPHGKPVAAPLASPGGARKCISHWGEVTYTNVACPSGSREQGLAGGTLTVVDGTRAPKAGAAPAPTTPPPPPRSSVYDVLDRNEERRPR